MQNPLFSPRLSNGNRHRSATNVCFYLTDVPPTFVVIAERFLGFLVNHVERIEIDHLCAANMYR